MILNILFAMIGLLIGGLINLLADDLPARIRPGRPHCPRCGYVYTLMGWLALGQLISGGRCPQCGLPTRRRTWLVEIVTAVVFAGLPSLIEPKADLVIYSVYTAVLILVIVIDLEHRLILHVVTFPTSLFAFIASFILADNGPLLAVTGALVGFLLFLVAYLAGRRLFGPGAFGFGDVTLATMMGMMLGLQLIFFALILGVLLAGLWSLVGLLTRRLSRRAYFAYGPFLAVAGIFMMLFGEQFLDWYMA